MSQITGTAAVFRSKSPAGEHAEQDGRPEGHAAEDPRVGGPVAEAADCPKVMLFMNLRSGATLRRGFTQERWFGSESQSDRRWANWTDSTRSRRR